MLRTLTIAILLGACGSRTPLRPRAAPWSTPAEAAYRTSETGLMTVDLAVGSGPEALSGTSATLHYDGWLMNGELFDSSRNRGTPFSFQLGQRRVIPGWEEGVLGMRVGGKRQLIIPPELAYGSTDRGAIPPDSTLVFEIELLSVQ